MYILKKVGGILLFLFGLLVAVAQLRSIAALRYDPSDSFGIGYFVGQVLGIILFGGVAFFSIKCGLRWAGSKK